jgi:hypothetical protein
MAPIVGLVVAEEQLPTERVDDLAGLIDVAAPEPLAAAGAVPRPTKKPPPARNTATRAATTTWRPWTS